MSHSIQPDDEITEDHPLDWVEDYDLLETMRERYEELADYNDSWARSNDDGWFYSDGD